MDQQAGNKLFELDIPVRWGDMDALGHVNNIMYFRYFEQVRIRGMSPLATTQRRTMVQAF